MRLGTLLAALPASAALICIYTLEALAHKDLVHRGIAVIAIMTALTAWIGYFVAVGCDTAIRAIHARIDRLEEALLEYGDTRANDGRRDTLAALSTAGTNGRRHMTAVDN